MKSIYELNQLVKDNLSTKRYEHTSCVMKLGEELARQYNLSIDDIKTACVLHDLTKEINISLQLQIIQKYDIVVKDASLYPNILHGITASLISKNEFEIYNKHILDAIAYHTTGRKNMSIFEKIVYLADSTSYDRNYDGVESLRKLSFENIDLAMIEVLSYTISSLIKRRILIHLNTIECYNDLVKKGV